MRWGTWLQDAVLAHKHNCRDRHTDLLGFVLLCWLTAMHSICFVTLLECTTQADRAEFVHVHFAGYWGERATAEQSICYGAEPTHRYGMASPICSFYCSVIFCSEWSLLTVLSKWSYCLLVLPFWSCLSGVGSVYFKCGGLNERGRDYYTAAHISSWWACLQG